MAVVNTRISSAATRPFLSIRLKRFCATTPLSASERVARILFCCSAGKTSMMRSTVLAALGVCSVPKTKWPGAGGHQRQFDGFQVAQFADQDDVRVFAQRAAQGGGKRLGVDARLRGG